ncbi:hypothetical protein [Pseudomonas asuensis]|nr:hypothetical protein [Pseudomonas asuensis]
MRLLQNNYNAIHEAVWQDASVERPIVDLALKWLENSTSLIREQ